MDPVQTIKERLLAAEFDASDQIIITDDRGDGYHLTVAIVSPKFTDKSRIKRSQMVYKPLDDLLKANTIHALSLKLQTPFEAAN